jgi:hypothetical protein
MLDVPVTNSIHYNERFTISEHMKLVNKAKVDQSCKTAEWPETGEGKQKQRYEKELFIYFY